MELQELLDNLNNSVSTSYDGNVDKVLEQVGLQQRQSTRDVVLPALGIFGAGIAVGATLGMLFAPKRGDELRTDLRQNLEDLREKSAEEYNQLREKSEEALKAARERVSEEEAQREGASSPSPGEKKTDGSARSSTGS